MSQKSPVYTQKSPVYHEKSPIRDAKEPCMPQTSWSAPCKCMPWGMSLKGDLFITKRALYVIQKSPICLYVMTRTLYALCLEVCHKKRGVYPPKSPVSHKKSPVDRQKSPIHDSKEPCMPLCMLSGMSQKEPWIPSKKPCMSQKEPLHITKRALAHDKKSHVR